ncbi:hypothetical protein FRC08_002293 [Ceratobasidium sp. 394]|nr:hypothetical protein FRC08_002293 [Ceratobasidium sp. 394]KAG9089477.1 hypothetical protein FS749_001302 [Ceratobasidium sp. UAMH 11750]
MPALHLRAEQVAAVRPKTIDTDLPNMIPHSFDDWNNRFDHLEGHGDDNRNRDIFALTGNYTRGGQRYRAALDIDRYELGYDIDISALCDIDSVLGIVTGQFPISPRATFMYYMLADIKFTLSTNLHLPTIEVLDGAEKKETEIHHIPNARFGEIGRLLVRIFFPARYDPEQRKTKASPNYVGNGLLQTFYDRAVRPATTAVLPEELRRQWPARFNDELFRAGPHRREAGEARVRGRVMHQQTGREVHGQYFNEWLTDIRQRIDEDHELAFARGFFLLVEGKGLKNTNLSSHDPPEAKLADEGGNLIDADNPRTTAIKAVLHDLVPAEFADDEWYIDIATSLSGRLAGPDGFPVSLFVDSELHPEIINHFSGKPLGNCSTWVKKRSGGYQKDEVAHVGRFAGFRITFDTPGAYGIRYLQVYTTEKSVTYHVDGRKRAKRTSPHLVLKDWETERDQHFSPLAEAYFHAAASHPVAVRIESRVPFEAYPYVHLELTGATLEPWLLCVRNTHIWGFKWRRLLAYWSVLERICTPLEARSRFSLDQLPEVGSLLVSVVYMSNALVNRPDEGGNFDEVHDSGCVHALVNRALAPIRPLGYYCLHSAYLPADKNTLPRISSLRTISRPTIIYLCASTAADRSELAILRLIRADGKRVLDDGRTGDAWRVAEPANSRETQPHMPNKQRRVVLSVLEDVPDIFSALLPDDQLRVRYPSEDRDDEIREAAPPFSKQISDIVHNYPLQIIAKAPNKEHQGGSWCSVTSLERTEVNFNTFVDPSQARKLFKSHNDFGRNADKWDRTVKALFPTIAEKRAMGKVQGLSQLGVWEDWETVLSYMAPDAAAKAVLEVRKYVSNHWSWLPFYTRKKLWVTGPPPSVKSARVVGDEGGPWIVFNPRFR